MKVVEVVKKLHKDYLHDAAHGCLDRAISMSCIMKAKGLTPIIKCFSYNVGERKYTHHFAVVDDSVYDCNEENTPTSMSEYVERQEKKHPKLIWGDSGKFIEDNYLRSDLLSYASRFDDKLRKCLEENSRWLPAEM